MAVHLDTNVVIAWSSGKDAPLNARVAQADAGSLSLSFVVEAELHVGLEKSRYPAQHKDFLIFLRAVRIAHSTPEVVRAYVQTRTELEKIGLRIGENDLWIAATALADDATLVTNNVREFSRVRGPRIEHGQA